MTEHRITTQYGTFEVRDARNPSSSTIFVLWPVNAAGEAEYDGAFTVNGKTYHGRLQVTRSRHNAEDFYLSSYISWNENLTDSAQAKLREEIAPIVADYPPLTEDERFQMVKNAVASRIRSLLNYEIDSKVWEELRGSGFVDGRNSSTLRSSQQEEIEKTVQAAVGEWLTARSS